MTGTLYQQTQTETHDTLTFLQTESRETFPIDVPSKLKEGVWMIVSLF